MQQEITALAKCRNVSVDQISPQELDREIFSKTPRTKNASIENPRQLGFTMIPSREDLNKILARREQMFEYNQSSEALFFDDDQPNTSESGL